MFIHVNMNVDTEYKLMLMRNQSILSVLILIGDRVSMCFIL